MRGLLALEFVLVRREIDDEKFPTRSEQSRGFGDCGSRIVEEV